MLVLDTETTGLIDNRSVALDKLPEVIEFCGIVVDLESGEHIKVMDMLIKPARPLGIAIGGKGNRTVTQLNGITSEMLDGRPTFAEVGPLIFDFIEQAEMVIAQNASFDKEMLDVEAERLGRTIRWPPTMCTVEQTIHLKGVRLSLSALHEHLFGTTFKGAHRARVDTEALVRCCVELHKRGEL